MVELNPLGAAVVKMATMACIKELPQTEQAHQYSVVLRFSASEKRCPANLTVSQI